MKLFARVFSVILLTLILALTLTSCGGALKGEYIRGNKVLEGYYEGYTFNGKNFTYDVYLAYVRDEALSYSGTFEYEIDKENSDKELGLTVGTIVFTYTNAAGTEVVEEKPFTLEETEKETVLKIGDYFFYYFEE